MVNKMNSYRKTAIIVGALFITAMFTGMLRYVLLDPILDAPDYLTNVSANENLLLIGVLLFFITAVALMGIAIVMYPILKKQNGALALGYVGVRIIEGVLLIISILAILTLFTLSKEFVNAGTPDISYFSTFGTLLLAVRNWAYNLLWPITLGLGGLMFYYLLYKSKLVPRWLSAWGFIGAILFPLSSISLFNSTILDIFRLPLVFNEIVLVVWLIVKGFNLSEIVSESVKTYTNKG
jgi:hypothetical protein